MNISNIYGIVMKRSSLQNKVSKFTPKSIIRLTTAVSLFKIVTVGHCHCFNINIFLIPVVRALFIK
jgi:hypothetical protein